LSSIDQKIQSSYSNILPCLQTAKIYLKNNNVLEAKKYIEEALRLDSDNISLRQLYGRLLSIDYPYGEVGFFKKTDPMTDEYTYANWGSRRWEYYYVEKLLDVIDVEDKHVVDIGIGLPSQHSFFTYYVKANCYLTAFDPDSRLDEITILSERCRILKKSAEKMEIETNSVDVVVVVSSFEHFPVNVFYDTVKEIYRILKGDGHLIITLDLTYNKQRSARWAVLEKTLNGFPPQENDHQLEEHHQQLTLKYFLELVTPYFQPNDRNICNENVGIDELVYSREWNSYIAYLHLYKNRYIYD